MLRHLSRLFVLLLAAPLAAAATTPSAAPAPGQPLTLWPHATPPDGPRQQKLPTFTAYIPASNPTHTAVVICPGGGYQMLATDWEGTRVAHWFNRHHVAAFVLQYRHGPGHHYPQPIDDGRRAVRWVRYHARQYHLDPHRIGIMGFSAGGHLAATVSTHYAASTAVGGDAIAKVSARPDFTILAYPVVTMKASFTHMGSRHNLIGDHPSPALVHKLSNETQVTAHTPPAFIYATNADHTVPPANSVDYYLALHRHHVQAELHIFRVGGHGSGLGQHDPLLSVWPKLLARWMAGMGLMDYRHLKPEPAGGA